MFVVKEQNFIVTDPTELLGDIQLEMQSVKFGFLNFYKDVESNSGEKWIGEMDDDSFKLFRLTDTNSTSDFYIIGSVKNEGEHTKLDIEYRFNFFAILGYLIFPIVVYGLYVMLKNEGILVNKMLILPGIILAYIGYTLSLKWDMKKTVSRFNNLINEYIT